jgi:replicative DNA helicase
MTIAEHILSLFHGRPDVLAVANGSAFAPQPLGAPVKPAWLEKDHLSGKRCFGFYLMTAASQVYCSCVDFDNKPTCPDPLWAQKAESVYYELAKYGLAPLIEISQSGTAAHVWLFFDEPVDAWLVREFWSAVSDSLDVPFKEVYPRQDVLDTEKGKGVGNLIRYPLWGQSRFVGVENDWATLEPLEALSGARKTDSATLRTVYFHITGRTPQKAEKHVVADSGLPARVDRLVSREHTLLGRRWKGDMEGMGDKSRSSLCQSIACELVRQYVPTVEIELALTRWCESNGYEKGERDDWVSTTVSKAYDFINSRQTERLATSSTMQDAALEYLESVQAGLPRAFGSGVRELDESIDGVGIGEVCVIAARPSVGKSSFCLQWVDNAALGGIPCLIISEEMSKLELGKRAILSITDLCEQVWQDKVDRVRSDVKKHYADRANIHLVEYCHSIDAVERLVDEHVALHDVKLVAVDYLQLLSSDKATRYDSVTDISRRLKQTATRNQVAMLVLCQLNREVEKRDGHDPRMSDLRESGAIEQDADLILMLQWPYKIDPGVDKSTYKIYCVKRRNGPIRTPVVFTAFDPERQKFGKSARDMDNYAHALDEWA